MPVHLRLARRERGEPAAVHRRLPGGRPGAAGRRLGVLGPRAGAGLVDQLPELRAGPRGLGRHPGGAALRGPRRAAAGVRAGPVRTRRSCPPCKHGYGRGRVGRRAGRGAADRRTGLRARRAGLAGPAPGRGPAVGHRGAVPEAIAVRAAAAGHRGPRDPGRGGGTRRPARGARGAGRCGDAAGAARRGRVRRAGPAAHRAALADRAA